MIFVDTGAWYAIYDPRDANHSRASGWLGRNDATLVTTDYVVSETLTLLRVRGRPKAAMAFGEAVFGDSEGLRLHFLSADEVRSTWQIFRSFADKGWSFTDCSSKLVMESLGLSAAFAFAFDHHFCQFGSITIVP